MTSIRFGVSSIVAAATVAGLCLGSATPAAASVNLLSNGSFESPVFGGSYTTVGTGGTVGAWTVDSGSIDLIGNYWQAQDGLQSVDMSGNGDGKISQTVNTTAGQQYRLSFWEAGNNDGGNAIKNLSALINNNQVGLFAFDTTGKTKSAMGWTQYTYDFVSAGGPTTVSFQGTEGNAYGAALDNVELKAVPEASTVMLFGMLFVGGAFLLRKRASQLS